MFGVCDGAIESGFKLWASEDESPGAEEVKQGWIGCTG
jgi:hypothetical protein